MSSRFKAQSKTDIRVQIHSVKTGNWKRLGDCSHAIHSTNPVKETYGEVSQPEYDEGDKTLDLGVLCEWLCVLCNYRKSRVDVWAMKVYGAKDSLTKSRVDVWAMKVYGAKDSLTKLR
nr:hypothetical protein [Tanacetum cinerariifolium]